VRDGPTAIDLRRVGLEPSSVTAALLLHHKHGHALYRLVYGQRSFVLKWFPDGQQASEVHAYTLLRTCGVPTLPVHGQTEQALLIEDLATSSAWRLATEADMQRPDVGTAVATWYRALHAAGRALMATPHAVPPFLRREVDALDGPAILRIGAQLGRAHDPLWRLAAEHIAVLKEAIHALPTTLTYNDFHWTNLALSRADVPPLRALVFDYHLLGIGPAYADYRNVSGALGQAARTAFQTAYGKIAEREALLDGPIAVLYSLQEALRYPQLPSWASDLVRQAVDGDLEARLQKALAII
jgi:hypothetical protein